MRLRSRIVIERATVTIYGFCFLIWLGCGSTVYWLGDRRFGFIWPPRQTRKRAQTAGCCPRESTAATNGGYQISPLAGKNF